MAEQMSGPMGDEAVRVELTAAQQTDRISDLGSVALPAVGELPVQQSNQYDRLFGDDYQPGSVDDAAVRGTESPLPPARTSDRPGYWDGHASRQTSKAA